MTQQAAQLRRMSSQTVTQLRPRSVQSSVPFILFQAFEVQNSILEYAAQQTDSIALLAQLGHHIHLLGLTARKAAVVLKKVDQIRETGALHGQRHHFAGVVAQVKVLTQELLAQLVKIVLGDRVQMKQVDERRVQFAYAVVFQHDHVRMRHVRSALAILHTAFGGRSLVCLIVRLDQFEQELLSKVGLLRFSKVWLAQRAILGDASSLNAWDGVNWWREKDGQRHERFADEGIERDHLKDCLNQHLWKL